MNARDQDMAAFAANVRKIMAAGDPAQISTVMDPEARVWENSDNQEFTLRQVGMFHHALAERLKLLEFVNTRITATSEGYLDRHTKRMVLPDGAEYWIPACLHVTLRDGRIFRAEEYLDSAQMPQFVREIRGQVARA